MSKFLTLFAIAVLICAALIAFLSFDALRIGAISPLGFLIRVGGPAFLGVVFLILARRAKASEGHE